MKIMIVGESGMLGSVLSKVCEERGDHTFAVSRRTGVDCTDPAAVQRIMMAIEPELVFNAAGSIRGHGVYPVPGAEMAATNSVLPLVLQEACIRHEVPLIHVSTDCVFSGKTKKDAYTVHDDPDPIDRYGRTKLAGEPDVDEAMVVRTSFIGRNHGLWYWAAELVTNARSDGRQPVIEGHANRWWSGSTRRAVAEGLRVMADEYQPGLRHLATSQPISKFEMFEQLFAERDYFKGVGLRMIDHPFVNRALEPTDILEPFITALRTEREFE